MVDKLSHLLHSPSGNRMMSFRRGVIQLKPPGPTRRSPDRAQQSNETGEKLLGVYKAFLLNLLPRIRRRRSRTQRRSSSLGSDWEENRVGTPLQLQSIPSSLAKKCKTLGIFYLLLCVVPALRTRLANPPGHLLRREAVCKNSRSFRFMILSEKRP